MPDTDRDAPGMDEAVEAAAAALARIRGDEIRWADVSAARTALEIGGPIIAAAVRAEMLAEADAIISILRKRRDELEHARNRLVDYSNSERLGPLARALIRAANRMAAAVNVLLETRAPAEEQRP